METINLLDYNIYTDCLDSIEKCTKEKLLINTINAHSYITAKTDEEFKIALEKSDILLPDGEGIVLMAKVVKQKKIKKIAGADIHSYLLDLANKESLKCFYLGASETTLDLIKLKQEKTYPNITFAFYPPPFKEVFSDEENQAMIAEINKFCPDILFIGMTAPKQEKWAYKHRDLINSNVICSIGAVFDFVAETKKRAPSWIINMKFEWLYRSFTAWRLTKRYLYSTPLFLLEIIRLKLKEN